MAEETGYAKSAAYGMGASVVSTFGDIYQQSVNAQMRADLAKFNNRMAAINRGVQQYVNDLNRNSLTDAKAQDDLQIAIDHMKSVAAVDAEAGATGASSSARRAALFDIDRNAVVAKFSNAMSYETALRQLKLSEFGANFQLSQSRQNESVRSPGILTGATATALTIGKTAIDRGFFDKGNAGDKMLTGIKNWFSGGSGVQLDK